MGEGRYSEVGRLFRCADCSTEPGATKREPGNDTLVVDMATHDAWHNLMAAKADPDQASLPL